MWKRKKRIVLVESSTIVAKDGETSQKNKKATTTWRKKKGTSRVCLAATVARCVLWIVKKEKKKKQFYYVKVQLGKITKIHLHLDLLRLVPATITERKTFAKIFTGRLRPRGTTTGSEREREKDAAGKFFYVTRRNDFGYLHYLHIDWP